MGALETGTDSQLADLLTVLELAASFLHAHRLRVSGEGLQVARTSPKHIPWGLPVRGPQEGRKVLFSISTARPDPTDPATFLFCPSGTWVKGNSVGSWLWAETLVCLGYR